MSDETPPNWAKGHSIEDLKRITTLFNRHDDGLLHGPFDRYRDRDAAADLHSGWLKLGPRDAEGVPAWAYVARELDRKQPVRDFTGGRVTLSPGTLYCTRMAFADADAAESIRARLRAHEGPLAIECWQEHPGERALVSDLRLAAVKIKESSAMRGLWVSHDAPDRPYPKQELLGIVRLALTFPQDALRALSSDPTVRDETSRALALRGFYDEPERIGKPSEMNRRWKSEHERDLDREPRDTPLRAALGAPVEAILAALPCAGFERIRLMRLAPGGEVSRHTDITDPDAGASVGKVVRVHVPLISNERCAFHSWDLDGSSSALVMEVGSAYYLDRRKPHGVVNGGDSERVHLVVDCVADAETVELLRRA